MRIIKATDSIPVDHPVFLVFGQPGIGKSTLAYSTRDALLLDFDKGAHRAANRRDTLVVDTWADVTEFMNAGAGLDPYASISVDTAGRCLDVMTADIIRGAIGFEGLLMSDDLGMRALSGTIAERAQAVLAAGSDLALVCSGDIAETESVAGVVPPLQGHAQARFANACAVFRQQNTFDVAEAEACLGEVLRGLA